MFSPIITTLCSCRKYSAIGATLVHFPADAVTAALALNAISVKRKTNEAAVSSIVTGFKEECVSMVCGDGSHSFIRGTSLVPAAGLEGKPMQLYEPIIAQWKGNTDVVSSHSLPLISPSRAKKIRLPRAGVWQLNPLCGVVPSYMHAGKLFRSLC